MLDLHQIKEDFSALVEEAQPWTLAQFAMWLDLKLAEYKVYGFMVLDKEKPKKTTVPRWLGESDSLHQNTAPQHRLYQNNRSRPVVPSRSSLRNQNARADNFDDTSDLAAVDSPRLSADGSHSNSEEMDSVAQEHRGSYQMYGNSRHSYLRKTAETDSRQVTTSASREVAPPTSRSSPSDFGNEVYIEHCSSGSSSTDVAPDVQGEEAIRNVSNPTLLPMVAAETRSRQHMAVPREGRDKYSPKISNQDMVPSSAFDDQRVFTDDHAVKLENTNENTFVPLVRNIKQSPSSSGYDEMECRHDNQMTREMDTGQSCRPSSISSIHENSQLCSGSVYSRSNTLVPPEYTLPTFGDPLIRKLLEDDVTRSRTVWTKVVQRCAYHLLEMTGGQPQSRDYQGISEAFYRKYPSIGMKRGKHPWSVFAKSLSQRIRTMRLKNRKMEQQLKQHTQGDIDNILDENFDLSCYDDSVASSGGTYL